MAVALATIASGYLHGAVAETVADWEGVWQHLQNLLQNGSQPSAVKFLDVDMDPAGRSMSIYADLHNAPTKEDVQKYTNSLGNPPDMVVTPGSNQKGHGGTAAFHADAKVGVLGAKAGELYMLALPQTSGMVAYMKVEPLEQGKGADKAVYNGDKTINFVLYATRTNALTEAVGEYSCEWSSVPDAEKPLLDRGHYILALEWLDGFLRSVGSSLKAACAAAFDKLTDTNGLCVHYLVLQDRGFATQTFTDGVINDIVIAKAGKPPLRLSHAIARSFDITALAGRQFRINGQLVDMQPLCPTSQPKVFGPISVQVPGGVVDVTVYSNKQVNIPDAAIVCKLGPLLLPEHCVNDRSASIHSMLNSQGARFWSKRDGRGVVDRPKGVLKPPFLPLILYSAGVKPADSGAAQGMPWPKLCDFVKDVCKYDSGHGDGLDFFRFVFGMKDAYMVVDTGSKFTTNNMKTGLFDRQSATSTILAAALPAVWIGMVDNNVPADYKAKMATFLAGQEQAAKAAADRAAAIAANKAAKAAAKPSAVTCHGGAASSSGAGAGGAAEPLGRGVKRKAAIVASKRLAEPKVPAASAFGSPFPTHLTGGPLGGSTPAAKVPYAALKAAHDALEAENKRLKAHNAALVRMLTAAGLDVPVAPVLGITHAAADE